MTCVTLHHLLCFRCRLFISLVLHNLQAVWRTYYFLIILQLKKRVLQHDWLEVLFQQKEGKSSHTLRAFTSQVHVHNIKPYYLHYLNRERVQNKQGNLKYFSVSLTQNFPQKMILMLRNTDCTHCWPGLLPKAYIISSNHCYRAPSLSFLRLMIMAPKRGASLLQHIWADTTTIPILHMKKRMLRNQYPSSHSMLAHQG